MDHSPIFADANSKPLFAPAPKVTSPSARPTDVPNSNKPSRRSGQFGFTVRLTQQQRSFFESLALVQGHASIAAAFKAQALTSGMDHPLQEMRLSLEHMQERITEEGAWLQDRIQSVSHALDGVNQHVCELVSEMQTCTQAMVLFAQTNEALAAAVSSVGSPGTVHPAAPPRSTR